MVDEPSFEPSSVPAGYRESGPQPWICTSGEIQSMKRTLSAWIVLIIAAGSPNAGSNVIEPRHPFGSHGLSSSSQPIGMPSEWNSSMSW